MPTPLLHNPHPLKLIQALVANQTDLLVRMACASGGEVHRHEDAIWIYTPRPRERAALLFPTFTAKNARAQIDAFLRFCRAHRPIREIAFWTEGPPQPWDLGARLVAQGFHWGFQPHWMGHDLESLNQGVSRPDGVEIGEGWEDADWTHEGLWKDRRGTAPFLYALTQMRPQRVWVFVAMEGNRVIGPCTLHLTDDPLVAGLYELGVVESFRGRGIGEALVRTACQTAREVGCRFAVLCSTNDEFYERIGFRSLGYGSTWWMREKCIKNETLTFAPPTPEEVSFVEAVGRGDIAKLDELGAGKTPDELNAKILGRTMIPMDLAHYMSQTASMEWLEQHGATPPSP